MYMYILHPYTVIGLYVYRWMLHHDSVSSTAVCPRLDADSRWTNLVSGLVVLLQKIYLMPLGRYIHTYI